MLDPSVLERKCEIESSDETVSRPPGTTQSPKPSRRKATLQTCSPSIPPPRYVYALPDLIPKLAFLTRSPPFQVLAEKAAWSYISTHTPAYDLITILPSLNLGPFIHSVSSPSSLASSLGMFMRHVKIAPPPAEEAIKSAGDAVDARDTAELHVRALGSEEAGGERIFSVGGVFAWQDVCECCFLFFGPISILESARLVYLLTHWLFARRRRPQRRRLPRYSRQRRQGPRS